VNIIFWLLSLVYDGMSLVPWIRCIVSYKARRAVENLSSVSVAVRLDHASNRIDTTTTICRGFAPRMLRIRLCINEVNRYSMCIDDSLLLFPGFNPMFVRFRVRNAGLCELPRLSVCHYLHCGNVFPTNNLFIKRRRQFDRTKYCLCARGRW
jgi:hypothetical protein